MSDSPSASDAPDPAATDALAAALRAQGWWSGVGLLPDELLDALARDCAGRHATGALQPAGTGRGQAYRRDAALRGDSIQWLESGAGEEAATRFLRAMQTLQRDLNRALLLGLDELEAHYAVYPAGTGYARHRDRFRDDDARVLSLVVYLNADWNERDGGELRLHLPDGARDVTPRRGTSVLFLSDEVEHEVLPARRERMSIAGWFRRRA